MISERVQNAIWDQINMEFSSAYSYLAMSAFCEWKEFEGCAKWLRIQSDEEHVHAMKLYDFLLARNCPVKLKAINAPEASYASIPEVFRAAYEQEKQVTASINELYRLAHEENAYATAVELQWFITEQVEEEKVARRLVAQFDLVKDEPSALLDLDRELGTRQPDSDEAAV